MVQVGRNHNRNTGPQGQQNRFITACLSIAVSLDQQGIPALPAITGAGDARFEVYIKSELTQADHQRCFSATACRDISDDDKR